MKKWLKRIKDELAELAIKIKKLEIYMAGEEVKELSPYHRSLLWHQLDHMNKYADILQERILISENGNKLKAKQLV